MDGKYEGAEHTYIYATLENIRVAAITERYSLPEDFKEQLLSLPSPFQSAYSECVYLRTYSRKKADNTKEKWADTVIRVVEGTIEAYLTHYKKNGLFIDMKKLNIFAVDMATSLFLREWSPPGRGLWAMGTDHTRANGNAALNNCYACESTNLVLAVAWGMDQSMCGGGVGFDTSWNGSIVRPNKSKTFLFQIPDTRQGWVAALELLLRAYIPVNGEITNAFPIFDFSLIRPYGEPIHGFGGTASGPEPLKILLKRVEIYLDTYLALNETPFYPHETLGEDEDTKVETTLLLMLERLYQEGTTQGDLEADKKALREACKTGKKTYGKSRLVVDIFNAVGACVVAGNVRRSAQIAIGDAGDEEFIELKNMAINPERSSIMWLSNNTVRFEKNEDFENYIPEVAQRIKKNGEPGFFNLINAKKFGRITDTSYGEDPGRLLNPCGEIILASYEPCTLSNICPSNCLTSEGDISMEKTLKAAEYATFYATTVTTVKHHWGVTNAVIAHNRRIGVSIAGITNIYEKYGFTYLTTLCRALYKGIRKYNKEFAAAAGIPRSIKVTTCKPDGSTSIIMSGSDVTMNAGCHFAICNFAKRRIALAKNSDLLEPLKEAGYPIEESTYDSGTVYVIFPLRFEGRPTREVSIYEQFGIVSALQRCFVDNSVSFTGHFSIERESEDVERVIAMFAPQIKSCSMFPYSDNKENTGEYAHMPFEEITKEEYEKLLSKVRPVVWKREGEDVDQPRGCTNDVCLRE